VSEAVKIVLIICGSITIWIAAAFICGFQVNQWSGLVVQFGLGRKRRVNKRGRIAGGRKR
jgi:hypothetical protein